MTIEEQLSMLSLSVSGLFNMGMNIETYLSEWSE